MSSSIPADQIVYMAHPLGGDVDSNCVRARAWLRWLMDHEPDTAFCVPWLPYVDVGRPDEKIGPGAIDPDSLPEYRARCLRDDITIAGVCDGIVLCGGRISPGMRMELNEVLRHGGFVADLTNLGVEPPKPEAWPWVAIGPITIGRDRWDASPS